MSESEINESEKRRNDRRVDEPNESIKTYAFNTKFHAKPC
jgi:hypothetical protein